MSRHIITTPNALRGACGALSTARTTTGERYTGNQQYAGNVGKCSCGRCGEFFLPVAGQTRRDHRYGRICTPCGEQLDSKVAARAAKVTEAAA